MRLSDAGFHQRQSEVLYPNHRLPPVLIEEVPRDRSNRVLEGCPSGRQPYGFGPRDAFLWNRCNFTHHGSFVAN